ncbi:MAG: DUF2721 domain-containing protein [Myxococcota bacterium]
MEHAGVWITPLALLPGVALLVMSTAIRFGQVHNELHLHLSAEAGAHHDPPDDLLQRAAMFRNALVALYASIALLAIAGLVGGMATLWMARAVAPVLALTSGAVACLAYAAVTLIRESSLLMRVIEAHGNEIRARHRAD